ncbi:MAG: AraC family transcriptional regulator [Clostridia bacterium]|nr:AraC family transcriptional regulator [Clostridia bacterium]
MIDLRGKAFHISKICGIIHDDSIHTNLGHEGKNSHAHHLIYKISGHVQFHLYKSGEVLDFSPGMICYIPRGNRYHIDRLEAGEALRIEFQTEDDIPDIKPFSELFRNYSAFGTLFGKLEACYKASLWNFDYKTMSVIYEIFDLLDSSARYSTVSPAAEKKASNAVSYLEKHYMDPALSIEDTAAEAGTSVASLRRYFQQLYGIPPIQYLTRLRINAAQSMLIGSDRSIEEIAVFSGFSDPFYFSRCFKELCGETPRSYRRSNKA